MARMVTLGQLAKEMGVSLQTVRRYAKAGKLQVERDPRTNYWRTNRDLIDPGLFSRASVLRGLRYGEAEEPHPADEVTWLREQVSTLIALVDRLTLHQG